MKLIRILAQFARGTMPSASRVRACNPRAVTVPAPRALAGTEVAPAARLADFRCSVPLRLASAEPPTFRS